AGTVNELSALSIPAIHVPLPGAEEQRQNALQLADIGAAVVIDQDDLTPTRLTNEIRLLVENPARLREMADAARGQSQGNAAARIADELERLIGDRSG
ncbi:MAG TPA: glycosyltransferase, partial [Thermomicrobiales bacterium]|nr:glycosyltransferase [Thermomicrobiales bacterium]